MPTYEYACKSCGEHLEVVQSFQDEPLTTCPGCGGSLRKVFGNIGIAFKGSGFYKNDSRPAAKDGRTAGAAKESSGSTSGTSSAPPSGSGGSSTPTAPSGSGAGSGSGSGSSERSGSSSGSGSGAPAAAAG
jgi:putative FmdB family regulatory protein